MKKLFLLFPLFLLCGCSNDGGLDQAFRKHDVYAPNGVKYDKDYYNVLIIDGCEYIKYTQEITHKGNCTNAIHSYNK